MSFIANPFNQNPDVVLYRVNPHSDEWYQHRGNQVNSSEVPTILGDNPFSEGGIWQLWQEKVGILTVTNDLTERMAMGSMMEDKIAYLWGFWHPSEPWYEQAVAHSLTGKGAPKRVCQKVRAVIKNKNYDWLATNLDRVAPPNQFKADFRDITPNVFQVEIKNIDAWVAQRYEESIPRYYHAQAQTQMLLTGVDYYEFAGLVGGNHMEVRGYYPDPMKAAEIIQVTKSFWHDNVLPAREMLQKAQLALEQGSTKTYDELMAQMYSQYEPDPVYNEQYLTYMKSRYHHEIDPTLVAEGDEEMKKLAIKHKLMTSFSSQAKKSADIIKAELEDRARQIGKGRVEFPGGGYWTWFPDKSGTPVFRNYVLKAKDIAKEELQTFIETINFEDYVI